MNYLAHGIRFLGDPYFLAGTAVPDWLSVADRKTRVRTPAAAELLSDDDEDTRQLAAGIVQHLHDDRWFHQSQVFAETNLQFALQLRDCLPGDEGFRPSFLGHIVIEILIDATLIERDPTSVDRYYDAIAAVSPVKVQQVVNRVARIPTDKLQWWIERFQEVRFLYDYLDDDKLLIRLEQVMRRVGLPPLGQQLSRWLPAAREIVAQRCDQLLAAPELPFPSSPIPLLHKEVCRHEIRNESAALVGRSQRRTFPRDRATQGDRLRRCGDADVSSRLGLCRDR